MIYSVGHSTHSIEAFLAATKHMDIIIDVRSHPTSRWEQFRKENMEGWLPEFGVGYAWWPSLGGWTQHHYKQYHEQMAAVGVDLGAYSRGAFPKQRIGGERKLMRADMEDLPQWTNQGLYDYAWYTSTKEFLIGADALIRQYGASEQHAAIMCSEALWWKCHRSMIADYLYYKGVSCGHLPPTPPKRPTTRQFKPHSEAIGNRIERYPAAVIRSWDT